MKRKVRRPPDWKFIADELYVQLMRRMEHDDPRGDCRCAAHLTIQVYDAARFRSM